MLSDEQLALYRVVARDANRFPELGRRYEEQVIERAHDIFVRCLARWIPIEKWKIHDKHGAAKTFTALLRSEVYDRALLGHRLSEREVVTQAHGAAPKMLVPVHSGGL